MGHLLLAGSRGAAAGRDAGLQPPKTDGRSEGSDGGVYASPTRMCIVTCGLHVSRRRSTPCLKPCVTTFFLFSSFGLEIFEFPLALPVPAEEIPFYPDMSGLSAPIFTGRTVRAKQARRFTRTSHAPFFDLTFGILLLGFTE